MSTKEIILAVVCAVLVVFSLVVALVVPKRNPDFPGRRVGVFFLVTVVLVAGMLATVEVYGFDEEQAEAAETEPAPAEEPSPAEPAPPAEPGAEPPAEEPAPAPEPAGDPAAGAEVFASAGCGGCHVLADAGSEGQVGPSLDESRPDYGLVVDRVTNGMGAMPAFGGQLSEQQIQDVAAYVVQATSG